MPKVHIQIVTHNSQKHLERLFAGIAKQRGVSLDVLVIDNASTDGTIEWLAEYKGSLGSAGAPLGMTIIKNQDNKGFARAHNQGFAECDAPYVLVLNPDVELAEGCLSEMIRVMEPNPPSIPPLAGGEGRIAAVTPKLYKSLPNQEKFGIIDSLGITMLPWGQVANIGENAPHPSPLPEGEGVKKVWGVSGACALYRVKALEAVKDEYGIFDERFWMYKEDADLAWRFNRAGFMSILASNATALHQRTVQKGDRQTRPDRFKQESIKNHVLMLRKNLFPHRGAGQAWSDWWRLPFILAYELTKFVYVALCERQNLAAYKIRNFNI